MYSNLLDKLQNTLSLNYCVESFKEPFPTCLVIDEVMNDCYCCYVRYYVTAVTSVTLVTFVTVVTFATIYIKGMC